MSFSGNNKRKFILDVYHGVLQMGIQMGVPVLIVYA